MLPFFKRNFFDADVAIKELLALFDVPFGEEVHGRRVFMPAFDVWVAAVVEEGHQG